MSLSVRPSSAHHRHESSSKDVAAPLTQAEARRNTEVEHWRALHTPPPPPRPPVSRLNPASHAWESQPVTVLHAYTPEQQQQPTQAPMGATTAAHTVQGRVLNPDLPTTVYGRPHSSSSSSVRSFATAAEDLDDAESVSGEPPLPRPPSYQRLDQVPLGQVTGLPPHQEQQRERERLRRVGGATSHGVRRDGPRSWAG